MKNLLAAFLILLGMTSSVFGLATEPKDTPKYWDMMESSVRIKSEKTVDRENGFYYGSGTIIFSKNHENYILTCGHLFDGKINDCLIQIFYLNGKKLKTFKEYKAKVIFLNLAEDVSLVFFKSDEKFLAYLPIAPPEISFKDGSIVESMGSDGVMYKNKNVSTYTVKIQIFGDKIQTYPKNSPTPGRSGGGMIHDGFIIGICSANGGGTHIEKRNGFKNEKIYQYDGNGIYIGTSMVRKLLANTNHAWLCNVYKNKIPKTIILNNQKISSQKLPKPVKTF